MEKLGDKAKVVWKDLKMQETAGKCLHLVSFTGQDGYGVISRISIAHGFNELILAPDHSVGLEVSLFRAEAIKALD